MDLCSQLANMLKDEQELKLAIIYGSVAAGTMRPNSDIDLALLFDQPLSAERKMKITASLERKTLRTVDIVDLSRISGAILKHVLCKGKILIQNEEGLFTRLAKTMIYNQTDMMPYVNRTLRERQRRFIDG